MYVEDIPHFNINLIFDLTYAVPKNIVFFIVAAVSVS